MYDLEQHGSPEIIQNKIKAQFLTPIGKISAPAAAALDDDLTKKFWIWTADYLKEKGFDGEWEWQFHSQAYCEIFNAKYPLKRQK